jgi:hypothetical protein
MANTARPNQSFNAGSPAASGLTYRYCESDIFHEITRVEKFRYINHLWYILEKNGNLGYWHASFYFPIDANEEL